MRNNPDCNEDCDGDCLDCEMNAIIGPFIPARCLLCEDYHFLNSELFYDCPTCEKKADVDLEIQYHVWMSKFF